MSEKIKFGETKSPEYRSIYTTGIFGGLHPDDAYMIFFQDRIHTETESETGGQRIAELIREAQVEVHMSPSQFKRIYLWMQKRIADYESVFGSIVIEPKKEKTEASGMQTVTVQ